jgi:hypothetical protein
MDMVSPDKYEWYTRSKKLSNKGSDDFGSKNLAA